MPAKSKSQQRLFGMALAYKRGELNKDDVSSEVVELANSMSEKDLKDFAKTKIKNLPNKVKKEYKMKFEEKLAEILSEGLVRMRNGKVIPLYDDDDPKNPKNIEKKKKKKRGKPEEVYDVVFQDRVYSGKLRGRSPNITINDEPLPEKEANKLAAKTRKEYAPMSSTRSVDVRVIRHDLNPFRNDIGHF